MMPPHAFDNTAVAYRDAHLTCQLATGNALDQAQDIEAAAVEALIATHAEYIADIGVKLGALADLMQLGRWSDDRDTRLLASIRRSDVAERLCDSTLPQDGRRADRAGGVIRRPRSRPAHAFPLPV
jgi:hypothetical protein